MGYSNIKQIAVISIAVLRNLSVANNNVRYPPWGDNGHYFSSRCFLFPVTNITNAAN
jgi:hypothetical protein